jgi:ribonuclease P protein component
MGFKIVCAPGRRKTNAFKCAYSLGDSMLSTQSLRRNVDFLRVYKRGKSTVTKYFVIYILKNRMPYNRLGITVSKKVGSAVKRNRAKRLLKESHRKIDPCLKKGFDIVLVARNRILSEKQPTIAAVLEDEYKKMGIWSDDV